MKDAYWVKCNGEAHDPQVAGRIDHCMVCLPWWESFPICPLCGAKLQPRPVSRKTGKGRFFCRACKKYCEEGKRDNLFVWDYKAQVYHCPSTGATLLYAERLGNDPKST